MKNKLLPGVSMRMGCIAILVAALAVAASADVEMSFAGRLEIDSPVRLTLAAKGALAPWRMMTTSGMTEREDGTRDFAFAADGAPKIAGEFRVNANINSDASDCLANARQKRSVSVASDKSESGQGGASRPGEPDKLSLSIDGNEDLGFVNNSISAEWLFTPAADVRMELFGLMGDLRMSDYGGGTALADGEAVALPSATAEPFDIRRQGLSHLELADRAGGKRLAFDFREPVDLFLQYWGGRAMSLRLILPPDDRDTLLYRGGAARRLAFALSGAGKCLKRDMTPVEIAAGPNWIPLDATNAIAEGSALDFSAMRPTGKPCGKFGRVVARGDHFEFEGLPGVPQRFYGANLCYWACFPKDLDDARDLARTLARVGYNAVRIHHHDGYCVAKDDPAATRLDETMMRRMDWLVAACSEEGLYISTDLFVSRTNRGIAWRAVGVDRDGNLSLADMKKCAPIHEGVFANYVAFASNWLCRVNSSTGLRYADEPALAWINLVNEGDLDEGASARPGYQEAWEKWLAAKKGTPAFAGGSGGGEPPVDCWNGIPATIPNGLGKNRHGRAYLLFLRDVEERFVARMRDVLRGIGCHALVSDMNDAWGCTASFQKVRGEALDYVDSHCYVDHPSFLEKAWRLPSWCPNENPFRGEALGAAAVSALRVFGRPFTVSEWDYCGPGRYRGVGAIATGAEAALQDWAGLWRFEWSGETHAAHRPGTLPVRFFDVAFDPLKLASERAGVCLFLRRDLEPLEAAYAVALPEGKLSTPDALIGASARVDWTAAAWRARIGCAVGRGAVSGGPILSAGDFDEAFAKSADEVLGEIRRNCSQIANSSLRASAPPCGKSPGVSIDREAGTFAIDTPRTCGVFAEGGVLEAGPLKVDFRGGTGPAAQDPRGGTGPAAQDSDPSGVVPALSGTAGAPATIWASSLDGLPLAESRRILVTHITDVQNTGTRYADAAMTVLLDRGRLPYLMRAGKAEVELRLGGTGPAAQNSAVFALSPSGERRTEIPCRYEGGVLRFVADVARDPAEATFLYEVVRRADVLRGGP